MDNVSLRPDDRSGRRRLGSAAPYLKEGTRPSSCCTRPRSSTSSCRRRSNSSDRDRARAARRPGLGRTQARDHRDRASSSRCRCSSTRATGSRSTPGPASTSRGRDVRRAVAPPVPGDAAPRERALELLYEAETKGIVTATPSLAELPVAPDPYAAALVRGVERPVSRRSTPLIARHATAWSVDRHAGDRPPAAADRHLRARLRRRRSRRRS